MGKDKIEESFLLGVLEDFLGKLLWKTSLENFFWRTSFGELRKILKFEGCYLIITTGDYGW